MAEQSDRFVLPVSIISPTDIARLKREIEAVDSFFQQSKIREGGAQQEAMPRLSKLMDQLAVENKLNILQDEHRAYVFKSLDILQASAPVMHISFSVDPPGSYVQKIVYWLRSNVHAQVLVTVGLQPNIGAGCIVRTTNRIFDFSLREYFNAKRDFFIEKMHESISEQPLVQGVTPTSEVVITEQATQPNEVAIADVIPIPDKNSAAAEAPNPEAVVKSEGTTPSGQDAAAVAARESTGEKIAVNVVASSGGAKQ